MYVNIGETILLTVCSVEREGDRGSDESTCYRRYFSLNLKWRRENPKCEDVLSFLELAVKMVFLVYGSND